MNNEQLIDEARDNHFEDMWADGSPCCPVCNCSWPCDASRLADALEAAQAALRRVFNQGHNDDCLFCGFKDRIALAALEAQP